jgi:hypothetical protein
MEIKAENFVWGEEPPSQTYHSAQSGEYRKIAQELKTQPGAWAVIATAPEADTKMSKRLVNLGAYMRSGSAAAFAPKNAFAATVRKVDGVSKLYARYNGEENNQN